MQEKYSKVSAFQSGVLTDEKQCCLCVLFTGVSTFCSSMKSSTYAAVRVVPICQAVLSNVI